MENFFAFCKSHERRSPYSVTQREKIKVKLKLKYGRPLSNLKLFSLVQRRE